MMISDVMRRANNEHDVLLLLSAYVETLQYHSVAQRLPPGAVTLPVRDFDDVETRFSDMLGAGMETTFEEVHPNGAVLNEATEIFGTAITRLQALRERVPS